MVLKIARHFLLLLSVLAAGTAVLISSAIDRVDLIDSMRLPTPYTDLSQALEKTRDLNQLKKACLAMVGALREAGLRNEQDDIAFNRLAMIGLKLALGFSALSGMALLFAWVAAGAVLRHSPGRRSLAEAK